MKKIFALILTAVMLIGVLPLGIFADMTESKISGALTWTLDKETMILTISGEGEMEDYFEGKKPNPFFAYREDITTVIIEKGVTSIGAHAFQNYKRLSRIDMPETLTEIGFGAFEDTLSLERIEFPESLKTMSDIFLMSEPVDVMVFKGNAPTLVDWSGFYREDNNNAVYLTRIFYMEDDITWTEEAKAAFGDGVIWNDDIVISDDGFTSVPDQGLPFKDVKENYWYYNSVEHVYYNGIMTGTAEDKFSPNMNLTRAQMVQMLFNMSGESKSDYMGKSSFDDVDALAWYAPAVNWADENEITSGVSETKFAPNKVITRQELARFLYTYASSTKKYIIYHREDLSRFSDQDKVADWAYDNLSWAVGAGIISGMTENTLAPRETATRAQAARMLMMFDEYLSNNVRVTTGAFRILADYIIEMGKYGGGYWPNTYVYRIKSGDKSFIAEYHPSSDAIQLYYCNGTYDRIIMTGNHSMCIEHLCMDIVGLTDSYPYYYTYDSYREFKGISTYSRGRVFADSYTETELEYSRYPDEKNEEDGLLVKQMKEEAMAELNGFVDRLLSECGLERQDLFITK